MTSYGIQHRATRRYVAVPPSTGVSRTVDEEARAYSWTFRSIAEIEWAKLGDFAGAFDVVPLDQPASDSPTH